MWWGRSALRAVRAPWSHNPRRLLLKGVRWNSVDAHTNEGALKKILVDSIKVRAEVAPWLTPT